MKKISLTTGNGRGEFLGNLLPLGSKITIKDIEDAVEVSKSAEELTNRINSMNLLRGFTFDRETDGYIRLKSVDSLGNVSYLTVYKDKDEKDEQIAKLMAERDKFLAVAYNAITLGQLNEQYSEKDLLKELGCTKKEYDMIME